MRTTLYRLLSDVSGGYSDPFFSCLFFRLENKPLEQVWPECYLARFPQLSTVCIIIPPFGEERGGARKLRY